MDHYPNNPGFRRCRCYLQPYQMEEKLDNTTLTVIRGKLTALETGYRVGILEAGELWSEAQDLLDNHPDMPEAERERAEALKLASVPPGAVL